MLLVILPKFYYFKDVFLFFFRFLLKIYEVFFLHFSDFLLPNLPYIDFFIFCFVGCFLLSFFFIFKIFLTKFFTQDSFSSFSDVFLNSNYLRTARWVLHLVAANLREISLSSRNHSSNSICKSVDWFLNDGNIGLKWMLMSLTVMFALRRSEAIWKWNAMKQKQLEMCSTKYMFCKFCKVYIFEFSGRRSSVYSWRGITKY